MVKKITPSDQAPEKLESPDLTTTEQSVVSEEEPAKKKRPSKRVQLVTASLAIVLIGVAAMAYYLQNHQQSTDVKSTTVSKVGAQFPPNFCFIRLDKLVCVDQKGSRVRYDLPTPDSKTVGTLVPSPDGTQFAAVASNNSNPFEIWILNKYLKPVKMLKLGNNAPDGPTFPDGGISWSHDGKSLLLTLHLPTPVYDSPNRQVFKYILATDKLTQLTNTDENSGAHELSDGRIFYWAYTQNTPGVNNGVPEHPMVMNGDGSNSKALGEFNGLPSVQASGSAHYDLSTDTLFYTYDDNQKAFILSWPSSKLGKSSTPTKIPVDFASSDVYVSSFDTNTLIYQHDNEVDFVDATSGALKSKVEQGGTPVGTLATRGGFPLTSPQVEGKYERIRNLSTAPADFQTYIKGQFDNDDPKCSTAGFQEMYSVGKVVRDQFANVEEGCAGGADYLYAKQNGQWQYVISLQQEPDCVDITKVAFTKEIITECYDAANNKSIQNPNP